MSSISSILQSSKSSIPQSTKSSTPQAPESSIAQPSKSFIEVSSKSLIPEPLKKSRLPKLPGSKILAPSIQKIAEPQTTQLSNATQSRFPFQRERSVPNSKRRSSPFAMATDDSTTVQDKVIPAVMATRTYTAKASTVSQSTSQVHASGSKPDPYEDEVTTVYGDISGESDAVTTCGTTDETPHNVNLGNSFNLYQLTPLTYNSRVLSMPTTAKDFCIAVLQQRWYQSIGSKLRVSAEEFKEEAMQGIQYLEMWNRNLEPQKDVLHRWAMNIMEEIEHHILQPDEATHDNDENGNWKYPSAIVSELIEALPLDLNQRMQYYARVCGLSNQVAQYLDAKPCKRCGAMEVGHHCIEQSCGEELLKSQYISNILKEFEAVSCDIGVDVAAYFKANFSESTLRIIKEAWMDDLDGDMIVAEEQEAENSLTLKRERWSQNAMSIIPEETDELAIASQPSTDTKEGSSGSTHPFLNVGQDFKTPRKAHRPRKSVTSIYWEVLPSDSHPNRFDWADEDESEMPESGITAFVAANDPGRFSTTGVADEVGTQTSGIEGENMSLLKNFEVESNEELSTISAAVQESDPVVPAQTLFFPNPNQKNIGV